MYSLVSVARGIGQHGAWKELHRELENNGVTVETLKAKKEEVFSALSGSKTNSDHQGPETNQESTALESHAEGVKPLLDKGATTNAPTNSHWSALHKASEEGHIDVVKELLDRGALIDAVNNANWTALHFATDGGHIEVVALLLDRGANINATTDVGNWALHHPVADKRHSV